MECGGRRRGFLRKHVEFPGLVLRPTPGHTAGSMSLLVRRGTPLLLVGDLTYGYDILESHAD